ncbi:ABC transporter substrate-binding protein, partial [Raoultella terrigena]|uniref:ABC transporter substrate-binding protein n=1 Tax=Raoultella terrigena TaxID=577 RepID=UPI0013300853
MTEAAGARVRPDQDVTVAPNAKAEEAQPVTILLHKPAGWEAGIGHGPAGDPRQATAVAQKFCDLKVAGVVGHLQSGTSIPASSLYDKCGLPHITAAATNPDLTKPGYKTTYRLIANDSALGAALAIYAADHLKLKTVAVIDDRTAYGQGVAQVFKATALQKG